MPDAERKLALLIHRFAVPLPRWGRLTRKPTDKPQFPAHFSFTIRLCKAPKVTVNPNSSPSGVNAQGSTSSAKGS